MLFKFILIDEIYANIRLWGFFYFLWGFFCKTRIALGREIKFSCLGKKLTRSWLEFRLTEERLLGFKLEIPEHDAIKQEAGKSCS